MKINYRLLASFLITVLVAFGTIETSGRPVLRAMAGLERAVYDWLLRRDAAAARKIEDIVIVDIDNDSLREIGAWPWPRDVLARLMENLFALDARLVGVGLPLSLPDDEQLRALEAIEEATRAQGGDTEILRSLRDQFDHDAIFAETIRGQPVVLGYQFDDSGRAQAALPAPTKIADRSVTVPPTQWSRQVRRATREWNSYRGYAGNLAAFLRAAKNAAGHLQLPPENDGIVRRAPVFVRSGANPHSSFALEIARLLDRPNPLPLSGAIENDFFDDSYLSAISFGRNDLPLTQEGAMPLKYLGRGGPRANFDTDADAVFRYVGAAEILAGRARKEDIRGKIVLLGASADILRDRATTPINPSLPRIEIHATALANIIGEDLLSRPLNARWVEIAAIVGGGAVLSILLAFVGPPIGLLICVLAAAAAFVFALSQWAANRYFLAGGFFILIAALLIWNIIAGFVAEWRRGRALQSSFGQYVPPELAKRISKSGKQLDMGGDSRVMSILFSDIRNFTAISEKFSPRELTHLMNRMLTALSECIHQNGGTVDKYIGDAVMAFWNAPLDDEKHATNAILAAFDMQKKIDELSREMTSQGLPEMRMGVGINSGETRVGNMGSALRVAYTVMGDTVNLSSRLEGLTKKYRTPILVGEQTSKLAEADIVFRLVDKVRVKGKKIETAIYQPMGRRKDLSDAADKQIRQFESARAEYEAGRFDESLRAFADYRAKYSDAANDGLVALYEERLADLSANPPAQWDGITVFEEK